MTANNPSSRTLGPKSAEFIDGLLKQGKAFFNHKEARLLLNKNQTQTTHFLSALVKRGIISRIKPGIFLIIESGKEQVQLTNWPLIAHHLATHLLSPHDYYISYYSAMRIHGMTTHAITDIYITSTKRLRQPLKSINQISYHFIYSTSKFFWGAQSHWISKQEKIFVSDIERTLLDGFARPNLCGGVKEVVRGVWAKQSNIDWDRLIAYAKKYHVKSAVKRLGFILDILELNPACTSTLRSVVSNSKDYVLLDPTHTKEGKYHSTWHLQININVDELKASVWT